MCVECFMYMLQNVRVILLLLSTQIEMMKFPF